MALRASEILNRDTENQIGIPLQRKRVTTSIASNPQRDVLQDIKNVVINNSSIEDSVQELTHLIKPRQETEKEYSQAVKISESTIERKKVTEVSSSVTTDAEVNNFADKDINADSSENTHFAVEYVYDIYNYLRQLEGDQCVKSNYLAGQTELLPKMRAILIDWLIEIHSQFHLLQETLYVTVAILDRFLQVEVGSVSRNDLQLVGVAALLIAVKYEELVAPVLQDLVYLTDGEYTEKEILKMEIRILETLEFKLGRPTPLHFLRLASKSAGVGEITHTVAKYIMELSLGIYSLCDVPPSKLSAAALVLAMRIMEEDSLDEDWNPSFVYNTKYRLSDIESVIERLEVVLVDAPTAKLTSVYQKYSNKKFMKAAKYCEESYELSCFVLDNPDLKKTV